MADQLDFVSVAGPGGFTSAWAQFSACRRYRYVLGRRWSAGELLPWIMLNPSTADAEHDDPTIRKCCAFAERLGFSGILVGNLFAFRATDPEELAKAHDPVGPENDHHLVELFDSTSVSRSAICAWGVHGAGPRAAAVMRLLAARGIELRALRLTKAGYPSHPLYLPGLLTPFEIEVAGG